MPAIKSKPQKPSPRSLAPVPTMPQASAATPDAAPTPPAISITSLLSQYPLLASLCSNLSSADIIHLAATSKENWRAVASSPKLLKTLIGSSMCDGRGIAAQARVFGWWKGDVNAATRKCRGGDAQPCQDCGAMVCNDCRFHIRYPTWGPYAEDTSAFSHMAWDDDAQLMWDSVWDDDERNISEWIDTDPLSWHEMRRHIEFIKADGILNRAQMVWKCPECEPVSTDFRADSKESCRCEIYEHFVHAWRCINCVLAKETRSIALEQQVKISYEDFDGKGLTYKRVSICSCGKPVAQGSIATCRWCGLTTWLFFDGPTERMMERLHAQFGTAVDGRAGDPILSQLG